MKFLSENFITKYVFCCLKQEDNVNIPWENMTQKQRAYRVKVLWIKARLVSHFIRMKQSANSDKKDNADMGMDFENMNFSQDNQWKWYIIRQENTLPQIWSFLVNTLTVYALFVTPFVLVFTKVSDHLRPFEMFVDSVFCIDMILNFFKLSEN